MLGPSRTANNTAVWRAMHNILDDDPKILVDPFARAFAGYSSDEELLKSRDADPQADTPWIRTQFALRNRLAEDELAEAVSRGLKQYIILGAGLDSFAYRRPDLMRSLDVYEVDHPVSQTWKRQRVAELGLEVPGRLHYAPIDFERQSLTDGLVAAGLDRNKSAFFSWLGVTQYLTRDAIQHTVREIANISTAGSTLVTGFIAPASSLSAEDGALLAASMATGTRVGEPWLSFFTSEEMGELLVQFGFSSVEHFGPEKASARYLLGRTDGSRLPAHFRMAKATTG
jgi:methyltransferase (TIGR00027 family)